MSGSIKRPLGQQSSVTISIAVGVSRAPNARRILPDVERMVSWQPTSKEKIGFQPNERPSLSALGEQDVYHGGLRQAGRRKGVGV
ncbi:hypothetical protein AMS68_000963 [Peltaster fructicola]|uniref:Uncharacterized protein n=1 Tax=Peltaster fructicola TaxID=286661 RepID=A0A6H0XL56_9PEZI|nr:hypothetical protein AMS68_000963 [Peltaster fructicola]